MDRVARRSDALAVAVVTKWKMLFSGHEEC